MRKIKNIVLLLLCVLGKVDAQQSSEVYWSLIEEAEVAQKQKDYHQAVEIYQKAFDANDGKGTIIHRNNFACVYAQNGNQKQAFYHLFYLANHPQIKYKELSILEDEDFVSLHQYEEWSALVALIKANKQEYEKDFNIPLKRVLDSIYDIDQGNRILSYQFSVKYGNESPQMDSLWMRIGEADARNFDAVREILNTHGWLGENVVGSKGNSALFLVIQHAQLENQLEFLPLMRTAVKNGKLEASNLALLEDRVALRQGLPQIYGSQVYRDKGSDEYYVAQLKDPEGVNERRAAVGLGPIEDYLKNWDIVWDVDKHKARFITTVEE